MAKQLSKDALVQNLLVFQWMCGYKNVLELKPDLYPERNGTIDENRGGWNSVHSLSMTITVEFNDTPIHYVSVVKYVRIYINWPKLTQRVDKLVEVNRIKKKDSPHYIELLNAIQMD